MPARRTASRKALRMTVPRHDVFPARRKTSISRQACKKGMRQNKNDLFGKLQIAATRDKRAVSSPETELDTALSFALWDVQVSDLKFTFTEKEFRHTLLLQATGQALPNSGCPFTASHRASACLQTGKPGKSGQAAHPSLRARQRITFLTLPPLFIISMLRDGTSLSLKVPAEAL